MTENQKELKESILKSLNELNEPFILISKDLDKDSVLTISQKDMRLIDILGMLEFAKLAMSE